MMEAVEAMVKGTEGKKGGGAEQCSCPPREAAQPQAMVSSADSLFTFAPEVRLFPREVTYPVVDTVLYNNVFVN